MPANGPVQDGVFICKPATEVVAAGEQRHIPYLIGMTSQDMMPPILYKMAGGLVPHAGSAERPGQLRMVL